MELIDRANRVYGPPQDKLVAANPEHDIVKVIGPTLQDLETNYYVKMVPVGRLHMDEIGENGVRYIWVQTKDGRRMRVAEYNLRRVRIKNGQAKLDANNGGVKRLHQSEPVFRGAAVQPAGGDRDERSRVANGSN